MLASPETPSFDSDESVASLDYRGTNFALANNNYNGPASSGLGRAAALGMDIMSPSEKRARTVLKRAHTLSTLSTTSTISTFEKRSRARTISSLTKASSKKRNIFSLLKRKKKDGRKSEHDIITTNAVAYYRSERSLVKTLGMAAEPARNIDDATDITPGVLDDFMNRQKTNSDKGFTGAMNTINAVVHQHEPPDVQSTSTKQSIMDNFKSFWTNACCWKPA